MIILATHFVITKHSFQVLNSCEIFSLSRPQLSFVILFMKWFFIKHRECLQHRKLFYPSCWCLLYQINPQAFSPCPCWLCHCHNLYLSSSTMELSSTTSADSAFQILTYAAYKGLSSCTLNFPSPSPNLNLVHDPSSNGNSLLLFIMSRHLVTSPIGILFKESSPSLSW